MTEQSVRLLGAECSDHGIYEHGCRSVERPPPST